MHHAAFSRDWEGGAPFPDWGEVLRLVAEAALATLREVVGGEGGRGSAADLLAADALLTYACEAAAEEGPAALEALTVALGPGHFEGLLDEARR